MCIQKINIDRIVTVNSILVPISIKPEMQNSANICIDLNHDTKGYKNAYTHWQVLYFE